MKRPHVLLESARTNFIFLFLSVRWKTEEKQWLLFGKDMVSCADHVIWS